MESEDGFFDEDEEIAKLAPKFQTFVRAELKERRQAIANAKKPAEQVEQARKEREADERAERTCFDGVKKEWEDNHWDEWDEDGEWDNDWSNDWGGKDYGKKEYKESDHYGKKRDEYSEYDPNHDYAKDVKAQYDAYGKSGKYAEDYYGCNGGMGAGYHKGMYFYGGKESYGGKGYGGSPSKGKGNCVGKFGAGEKYCDTDTAGKYGGKYGDTDTAGTYGRAAGKYGESGGKYGSSDNFPIGKYAAKEAEKRYYENDDATKGGTDWKAEWKSGSYEKQVSPYIRDDGKPARKGQAKCGQAAESPAARQAPAAVGPATKGAHPTYGTHPVHPTHAVPAKGTTPVAAPVADPYPTPVYPGYPAPTAYVAPKGYAKGYAPPEEAKGYAADPTLMNPYIRAGYAAAPAPVAYGGPGYPPVCVPTAPPARLTASATPYVPGEVPVAYGYTPGMVPAADGLGSIPTATTAATSAVLDTRSFHVAPYTAAAHPKAVNEDVKSSPMSMKARRSSIRSNKPETMKERREKRIAPEKENMNGANAISYEESLNESLNRSLAHTQSLNQSIAHSLTQSYEYVKELDDSYTPVVIPAATVPAAAYGMDAGTIGGGSVSPVAKKNGHYAQEYAGGKGTAPLKMKKEAGSARSNATSPSGKTTSPAKAISPAKKDEDVSPGRRSSSVRNDLESLKKAEQLLTDGPLYVPPKVIPYVKDEDTELTAIKAKEWDGQPELPDSSNVVFVEVVQLYEVKTKKGKNKITVGETPLIDTIRVNIEKDNKSTVGVLFQSAAELVQKVQQENAAAKDAAPCMEDKTAHVDGGKPQSACCAAEERDPPAHGSHCDSFATVNTEGQEKPSEKNAKSDGLECGKGDNNSEIVTKPEEILIRYDSANLKLFEDEYRLYHIACWQPPLWPKGAPPTWLYRVPIRNAAVTARNGTGVKHCITWDHEALGTVAGDRRLNTFNLGGRRVRVAIGPKKVESQVESALAELSRRQI